MTSIIWRTSTKLWFRDEYQLSFNIYAEETKRFILKCGTA